MGPLAGFKVVEIGAIGPGPWCAMMLSDMGAEVIRVERADNVRHFNGERSYEFVNHRGRRSVGVDLKSVEGVETVLRLAAQADALIEGSRPGVAERLGIGPEDCQKVNPRLVYGRMTGWGQDGPMAQVPGHDINYLALSGLLHAIGPADRPIPPINLVGDYAGGGMLLALGVICALLEASRSGRGQVVDAAMVDGVNLLGSLIHGLRQIGEWEDRREANRLDGAAHYYRTYETADGRWISIAANEPKFYAILVEALELSLDELPYQDDSSTWPQMGERFAAIFRTKTRDQWVGALQSLETCFAPVLTLEEAPHHAHNVARGAFVSLDGVLQPAPAPRFGRTPGAVSRPAAKPGEHTVEVLKDWGFTPDEIAGLADTGAVAQLPEPRS
ncbi:CaiB/BaiF CoA transferase family protein [Streptomyces sp. NPDC048425]|uniref:CaiB/BaiF CoA transferase family protein n=1 Tax=Streptomyces sp. NPDC048425 TaxID=3365548 RepID=UPI00371AB406